MHFSSYHFSYTFPPHFSRLRPKIRHAQEGGKTLLKMRATNSIPALAAGTRPKDKEADDEQGGEKMTPDLLRRLALAHDGTWLLRND